MSIIATQNILGGNAGTMRPTDASTLAVDYAFSGLRKNYSEYIAGTLKRGGAVRNRSGKVAWTDPSTYVPDLSMPDIINQPPPPYEGNTGEPLRPGGTEDEQVQYAGEAPSMNTDGNTQLGQIADQLADKAEGNPVITDPDSSAVRSAIIREVVADAPTTSGGPSLTYNEEVQYQSSETADVDNGPSLRAIGALEKEVEKANTTVSNKTPAELMMEQMLSSAGVEEVKGPITDTVDIYDKSEDEPPVWATSTEDMMAKYAKPSNSIGNSTEDVMAKYAKNSGF